MSSEPVSKSDLEIVRSILDGADAEVARILGAAQAEAEAEHQRTHVEAEAIKTQILAAAEEEVERFRTRELATAGVEARRMLLWAREDKVSATLARIAAELQALWDDAGRYRESLVMLAAEAIVGTGGSRVRLKVGDRDRAIADDAFVERVKAAVRALGGSDVTVDYEFDTGMTGGGCIASDPDDRIVYNNTYERRLERARRDLRRTILRAIEHDHE